MHVKGRREGKQDWAGRTLGHDENLMNSQPLQLGGSSGAENTCQRSPKLGSGCSICAMLSHWLEAAQEECGLGSRAKEDPKDAKSLEFVS